MMGLSTNQLKQIAGTLGIQNCGDYISQSHLVRLTQDFHGHEPCFATEKCFACAETNCEWRDNCHQMLSI